MAEDIPRHPTGEWYSHQEWAPSIKVAVSAAGSAVTSALSVGNLYVICADHAWTFAQGNFASGVVSQVAASNVGMPLAAYEKKYIWVWSTTVGGVNDIGNNAVAGVSVSGSGSFWYTKVRP